MCPNPDYFHGDGHSYHVTEAIFPNSWLRFTPEVEGDKKVERWRLKESRKHFTLREPNDYVLLQILKDTDAVIVSEIWQVCGYCQAKGAHTHISTHREAVPDLNTLNLDSKPYPIDEREWYLYSEGRGQ
jgi:hypothetical protein